MTKSVVDRVKHRMPRPVHCDVCLSKDVHLQSRRLMGLRDKSIWPLIWHCMSCDALVGCHEGTDIPLGLMASRATREARWRAHQTFDPLWKGRTRLFGSRDDAYLWMATTLVLSSEDAHISKLTEQQCEELMNQALRLRRAQQPKGRHQHWKHTQRKRRRD